MRKQVFLAAVLSAIIAAPASAQVMYYRRFTEPPIDVNRNNLIIYGPLVWVLPDKYPDQPYNISSANWYQAPLTVTRARPDKVLDGADYLLESFEVVRRPGERIPLLQAVITRRPRLAPDAQVPMLQVVHPENLLMSRAFPTSVEILPDGVRFTYLVKPPMADFPPLGDPSLLPTSSEYSLEFLPATGVQMPRYIVGAPTFTGLDPDLRVTIAPPRLPNPERVAGKRIEFRAGQPVVVQEGRPDPVAPVPPIGPETRR